MTRTVTISLLAGAVLALSACAGAAGSPADPTATKRPTGSDPVLSDDAQAWFAENCPTRLVALDHPEAAYGMVSGVVSIHARDLPTGGARLFVYDESTGVMTPKVIVSSDTPLCLATEADHDGMVRARDAGTGAESDFYPVKAGPGMPSPAWTTYRVPTMIALDEELSPLNGDSGSTRWLVHPFSDVEQAVENLVEGPTDPCAYEGVVCED